MPINWYLVPYKRHLTGKIPSRYCAMDDFTPGIQADGGAWAETEVLGNHAIVKVRARTATLTLLNAQFQRLPGTTLTDTLTSLTTVQVSALQDIIIALGYSAEELKAALGTNLRAKTLGDVLRFIASRRLKPRYDAATDTILLDGPVQSCRTPDVIEGMVT